MRDLDRLAGSYLDLLWHFDPAAASAAGFVSTDGRLGQFDAEAMRTHLAAFRATTAAIEELEIEELADEIDRTALLEDVRATIARLDEDRPHIRDPGFWLTHLVDALAALMVRPADDAVPDPGRRLRPSALPRSRPSSTRRGAFCIGRRYSWWTALSRCWVLWASCSCTRPPCSVTGRPGARRR